MEEQPLLQSQKIEENYKAATTFEEKQDTNITMPTAIDHMNSYKGQGAPHPLIPISGILLGIITPYMIYTFLGFSNSKSATSNAPPAKFDSVILLLQSMVFVAGLFFSEFLFGAMARSKCPKAGFSPAAAQASGNQPFEIIEANRIHQNQIESACIYIPASLSAAAVGVNADLLIATTITWVIGRLVYRYGYCQRDFPMWRLVGLEVSLTQSLICIGYFIYHKVQNT